MGATRFINIIWGLALLIAAQVAHAENSINPNVNFEIAVVETLPDNINLNMSLSEIEKLQNSSRIGKVKQKIYGFLKERLSPLLSEYANSDQKDVLALASDLPIDRLIKDLQSLSKTPVVPHVNVSPADFVILILPKTPESQDLKGKKLDYSKLYSKRKASVIDREDRGFNPKYSVESLLNKKLESSLSYLFNRNYIQLKTKKSFFVGALFNVHLEGSKTWIRTQILSTSPTDREEEFVESSDQVDIKSAHFPTSPTEETIKGKDYPGVIVESLHKPQQKNAMFLNIKFGNLGKLNGLSWEALDKLDSIEDNFIGSLTGVGVDFFTDFNLPYLYGELKEPEILKGLYNVRIKIHEVNFDVNKLEIEKIRVSLKLIPAQKSYVTDRFCDPVIVPFPIWTHCYLKLPNSPTLEMSDASEQFTQEGNKAIEPLRKKVKTALETNPEQLLQDPKVRGEVLKFVLKFMESKQTVGSVK